MIDRTKFYIVLVILVISGYSCTKTQLDKDREIIEKYIADKNLDALEISNSGMFYVTERPGGVNILMLILL